MTIRVVIADDQPLARAGLAGIIRAAPDLAVVGEAATGHQAIDLARERLPDVLLMDIRMPGLDGLEATRVIVSDTDVRVLVLTTFDLDDYIFEALENGASGFLLKDTPGPQLQEAIRVVASGEALLSPSVTRRVIGRLVRARDERSTTYVDGPDLLSVLTPRERVILERVAAGESNAEISVALHITHGTVKSHVSNMLSKLQARDRIQLVILALGGPAATR